jgi:hypothetical protein
MYLLLCGELGSSLHAAEDQDMIMQASAFFQSIVYIFLKLLFSESP